MLHLAISIGRSLSLGGVGVVVWTAISLSTEATASARLESSRGTAATAPASELKVLTFNMKGLPPPLAGDETRFADAAELMTSYDVVAIQEAFSQAARDALSSATFPYKAFGNPGRTPLNRTGDGLVVLSRHPIVYVALIEFEQCFWIDCLSRKGAMLVRLAVDDIEVDVYTTHLQAYSEWQVAAGVREEQIRALRMFFTEQDTGNPLVLLGDFNLESFQPEYLSVERHLGVRDAWVEAPTRVGRQQPGVCAEATWEDGCQRIDYVFVRDGTRIGVAVSQAEITLHRPLHGRTLSDHFALGASLRFRKPTPRSGPAFTVSSAHTPRL